MIDTIFGKVVRQVSYSTDLSQSRRMPLRSRLSYTTSHTSRTDRQGTIATSQQQLQLVCNMRYPCGICSAVFTTNAAWVHHMTHQHPRAFPGQEHLHSNVDGPTDGSLPDLSSPRVFEGFEQYLTSTMQPLFPPSPVNTGINSSLTPNSTRAQCRFATPSTQTAINMTGSTTTLTTVADTQVAVTATNTTPVTTLAPMASPNRDNPAPAPLPTGRNPSPPVINPFDLYIRSLAMSTPQATAEDIGNYLAQRATTTGPQRSSRGSRSATSPYRRPLIQKLTDMKNRLRAMDRTAMDFAKNIADMRDDIAQLEQAIDDL